MKRRLVEMLALVLCLGMLSACGNSKKSVDEDTSKTKTESLAKEDETDDDESEVDKPVSTMDFSETDLMDWNANDYFGAILLGGGTDDLDAVLASPEVQALSTRYPDLKNARVTVDMGGDEYYAILPRYAGEKFEYSSAEIDFDTNEYKDDPDNITAVASDGSIMIIHCNKSDLYSNIAVMATAPQGSGLSEEPLVWHPYNSPRDGQVVGIAGVHIQNIQAIDQDRANEVFESSIGWGGSAGSYLNSAQAASDMLLWSRENYISRHADGQAKSAFDTWYQGLDEETQQVFDDNIAGIIYDGDMILANDPSMTGVVSDAGLEDTAQEIRDYEGIDECWTAWKEILKAEKLI